MQQNTQIQEMTRLFATAKPIGDCGLAALGTCRAVKKLNDQQALATIKELVKTIRDTEKKQGTPRVTEQEIYSSLRELHKINILELKNGISAGLGRPAASYFFNETRFRELTKFSLEEYGQALIPNMPDVPAAQFSNPEEQATAIKKLNQGATRFARGSLRLLQKR